VVNDPGDELTVLTQNAWGGAAGWETRLELMAKVIAERRPHVIGLQEVYAATRDGHRSQAHQLAERLGGYDTYWAPGKTHFGGDCEGVALLCERSVREHAVETLTLDPTDPFDGDRQRVVLCARIEVPAVDVFVTHLSLSALARYRTIGEITGIVTRQRASSASAGAILLGDFNAPPEERSVMALVDAGSDDVRWTDTWRAAHPGERGGTWPPLLPFRRIDYVLVNPPSAWQVVSCERLRFAGSDHLGVLARVRVRAASGPA
jgi:endonuclease/exonuclease/phosphatase family metal-dependent hydrolase